MRVTFTYRRLRPDPTRPTVYEALKQQLGREPTPAELVSAVRRILREGADRAARPVAGAVQPIEVER